MLKKLNEVLSLFTAERTELSVLEVAALLQRPRSTVYRLLSNIEREGFLDQDELTGLYRLGIRLSALGELAAHSTSLQRLARPILRRLHDETGETATLMLLAGNEGITVDVIESFQPLMTPGLLGMHNPLHASAGGKAFLAWLPGAERDGLIKPPLKRYTSTTITDVTVLARELELARERGYTTVNGEFAPDVIGAAAPIWNHRDSVVAALTVGGPRIRVTPEKLTALGRAVVDACAAASRKLGHRSGPAPGSAPATRAATRPALDPRSVGRRQAGRPNERAGGKESEARLPAREKSGNSRKRG